MLDGLYKPRSVAVIGASRNPLSIGYRVLVNLRDNHFTGTIFPVNPKEPSIAGFKAYKSVLEIPDEIDLVNISIPAKFVPQTVEECGKKGVKFIIIHSAGFKEVGPEGEKLEKEVVAIAKKYGMRIYGPNSQGVMNSDPNISLYANFTFTPMKPGNISILAQSGGIAELINLQLESRGLGFRMYGSNGNASDITIDEILEYFGQDEETKVILLYVESFQNPARFVEIARKITPNKPILAIKTGTSEEGARAITSHTGALVGKDTITDALFEKAGVVRFTRLEELVDAAIAFSKQPLPKGKRVTIVTNAGGPAIQATDEAIARGLELSVLSKETQEKLRQKLNPMSSVANPVDMTATAGPSEFAHTLRTLLEDPDVHSLLLSMVTPFFVDNEGVLREVLNVAKDAKIPIVATYLTNKRLWGYLAEGAFSAGIPTYDYPETASAVLAAMSEYVRMKGRPSVSQPETITCDRKKTEEILKKGVRGPGGFISFTDSVEIMKFYGIPFVSTYIFNSIEEIESNSSKIPFPCVLKIDAEGIIHKTEVQGVSLDITKMDQLLKEAKRMAESIKGKIKFVIQPMIKTDIELIMGIKKVHDTGTLIMVGTGGIYTEILKDVEFRLCPLSRFEANEMVKKLKIYEILKGARGRKPVDITQIEDMLLRLSALAMDNPSIEEIDLNPVMVTPVERKVVAVDVRIKAPLA